jgi:uncharacterized protein YlxW (UPF0749 family)
VDAVRRHRAAARPGGDGLLEHLARTALDEDYAVVAGRRAVGSRDPASKAPPPSRRPGVLALVVLAVFGVLVTTAGIKVRRDADQSATSRETLVRQADARKSDLAQRRTLARALQRDITSARVAALEETATGQALQKRLDRLGVLTGATVTRGPGVVVRLDDAPDPRSGKDKVQAPDLQKLVNALWVVGAEAVSVNGYRVTSLTSIRDAAGAVTVNFKSLTRPYLVSAIGPRDSMAADLLDTAGYQTLLTLQSTFGLRLDVDSKDSLVLPAAGSLTLRHAHEAEARR